MTEVIDASQLTPEYRARRDELYREHRTFVRRHTDRMFAIVMAIQYVAIVIGTLAFSPRTFSGATSAIHPHVWQGVGLGFLIAAPVWWIAHRDRGAATSLLVVPVCQLLMSCLIIHLTGGRIESHFHVFVSLAFLTFYRDYRVFLPATLTVVIDHGVRGYFYPMSVYGMPYPDLARLLEHSAWVVFQDVFVVAASVRGVREMKEIAVRQALLEQLQDRTEQTVVARTEELRQSEARKGAVLENAQDAILVADERGLLTDVNPAAEAVFGIRRAQALGLPLEEFVRRRESAGGAARYETVATRADGKTFAAEVSRDRVRAGRETVETVFVRDLTERHALESKLAHAQKMETIGGMSAGIAHEINTPNQYIGDNVRFLDTAFEELKHVLEAHRRVVEEARAGAVRPESLAALDEAKIADAEFLLEEIPRSTQAALEGVESVEGIVHAMKNFAHPGAGSYEDVDLNEVIRNAVTLARNEWKYVADVQLDLDPHLPKMEGRSGEIGQAVVNIVVNAAHAVSGLPTGEGRIRVSTRLAGGAVRLEIEDNGTGIPADVLPRIFEPFFTTKGVGVGTGQGLAIAHSVVVNRHRGEINATSKPGEGTRFTLFFPLRIIDEVAA
ncbi:MAG: two-component system sensor histidine kinase NtrB [Fimbriimonas sp.]